ncbi:hypothetical protein [Rhizobium sp. BK456]|uniref:hypothetical protein n=1 Tax=Rhizobium sp. BK456 TaxID=2587007 RepID=UPI0018310F1E|nr:hypothetical protein [Rhizobium sp. BK456]MBB3525919.1 hypothetical protein [Rhizobium sp. BK456]
MIEITPAISKPRRPKTHKDQPSKDNVPKKARRTEHHPLLFGVEGHLRKSWSVKDGEFLRPYKRLLPDLISSEAALPRTLRIANALYLALDERGYRVHIAPQSEDIGRIPASEQEVELKDRSMDVIIQAGSGGPTGRPSSTSTACL